MDKITHQIRAVYWTKILNECISSGMSKTAWCRANGISEKQFFYWQRISWAGRLSRIPRLHHYMERLIEQIADAKLNAMGVLPKNWMSSQASMSWNSSLTKRKL
ncbi:IS66 family insertion sequence element accessory protein TnpA [Blautia pseudococcoides]|uniref:IS66 family insertion sequence element accessory protein TnpA n=1 Tax=Blautia pseudococcoides TaxID=1796616 RepID=UPI00080CB30D|nr:hypothetical protein [Blautia pseudococcoides]